MMEWKERKNGRIYGRRKARRKETPGKSGVYPGMGGNDLNVGGACVTVVEDCGIDQGKVIL